LSGSYAVYFRGRYGTDSFENGVFRRLLDIHGSLCLVSVSSKGTIDSPALTLELTGLTLDKRTIAGAKDVAARLMGTEQDLHPFYTMAANDVNLTKLVHGLYGLHLPQTASVFEAIVLAVLGQQISAAVAMKLRTSLIETYGAALQVDGTAYHAFPRPETLAEAGIERLRAVGLSNRKAEYISDIARKVAAGELNPEALRSLPDDEIVATLTGIRGIGPWTAHWLLIRALGRPDGFPASDLALMRMVGTLTGKGAPLTPTEAEEYSRRWSPFRSFVTVYLFAAARSGRIELITSDRTV
jgi:3-methyladenine DNA glycosylase/8-oxoguanine DNA glycosylase